MDERVRRITCITCPIGCSMEVFLVEDKILRIKRCRCPKGRITL